MSKDLFYFNRQDRIATVVLLAIIIATLAIRMNVQPPVPCGDAVISDSIQQSWVGGHDTVTYRYRAASDESRRYVRQYRQDRIPPVRVTDTLRDSLSFPRYKPKQRPLQPVDLNVADSVQLTILPGIGAWTAQKILRYRNALGGFVSEKQILEIEGIPDSLLQWFAVSDSVPVARIRVNMASISELRRHPYLNFYQARAIVELRRDRGKVQGPGQLSLLEEFTERDLERLEPYLDYE